MGTTWTEFKKNSGLDLDCKIGQFTHPCPEASASLASP